VGYGSRPPAGPTPTLLSIVRDLARFTPRIENLGVGSHTKNPGVGLETRREAQGEKGEGTVTSPGLPKKDCMGSCRKNRKRCQLSHRHCSHEHLEPEIESQDGKTMGTVYISQSQR